MSDQNGTCLSIGPNSNMWCKLVLANVGLLVDVFSIFILLPTIRDNSRNEIVDFASRNTSISSCLSFTFWVVRQKYNAFSSLPFLYASFKDLLAFLRMFSVVVIELYELLYILKIKPLFGHIICKYFLSAWMLSFFCLCFPLLCKWF